MARDEGLDPADLLGVPPEGQLGLDSLFGQRELQLLEAPRLGGEGLAELRQRLPAPQREGA